jgi:hypothetical protein
VSRVLSLSGWLVLATACGPAPGWVEEPSAPAPELPPEDAGIDEPLACRNTTPVTRLQGRSGRFSGVEGMNSLACPPGPMVPGSP